MTSIKSKIVFITLALLFALGAVVVSAASLAFYHDKELLIASNNAFITAFDGQVNTEIAELEKNALDLALMGEVYYQKGKQQQVGDFSAQRILKNYAKSMGNGLYFAPYISKIGIPRLRPDWIRGKKWFGPDHISALSWAT